MSTRALGSWQLRDCRNCLHWRRCQPKPFSERMSEPLSLLSTPKMMRNYSTVHFALEPKTSEGSTPAETQVYEGSTLAGPQRSERTVAVATETHKHRSAAENEIPESNAAAGLPIPEGMDTGAPQIQTSAPAPQASEGSTASAAPQATEGSTTARRNGLKRGAAAKGSTAASSQSSNDTAPSKPPQSGAAVDGSAAAGGEAPSGSTQAQSKAAKRGAAAAGSTAGTAAAPLLPDGSPTPASTGSSKRRQRNLTVVSASNESGVVGLAGAVAKSLRRDAQIIVVGRGLEAAAKLVGALVLAETMLADRDGMSLAMQVGGTGAAGAGASLTARADGGIMGKVYRLPSRPPMPAETPVLKMSELMSTPEAMQGLLDALRHDPGAVLVQAPYGTPYQTLARFSIALASAQTTIGPEAVPNSYFIPMRFEVENGGRAQQVTNFQFQRLSNGASSPASLQTDGARPVAQVVRRDGKRRQKVPANRPAQAASMDGVKLSEAATSLPASQQTDGA